MTVMLADRLNQVLPLITSDTLLSSEGIGNEIACYIFDYPAQNELQVRKHLDMMMDRLKSHHSDLRVLHLNIFDEATAYLKKRGFWKDALKMEATNGDAAMLKELRGLMSAEKIRDFLAEKYNPADQDLLLLSGIGSMWPMLRAHSLLNSLHAVIGQTPLVMFYPGAFDGTTLRLFNRIDSSTSKPRTNSYYRAFILVPGGAQS